MREIRQSGSEGGESNLPYPYPAQGEVGEALGNRRTHDPGLKGPFRPHPYAKPCRKQGGAECTIRSRECCTLNGPFRADGHSNTDTQGFALG